MLHFTKISALCLEAIDSEDFQSHNDQIVTASPEEKQQQQTQTNKQNQTTGQTTIKQTTITAKSSKKDNKLEKR